MKYRKTRWKCFSRTFCSCTRPYSCTTTRGRRGRKFLGRLCAETASSPSPRQHLQQHKLDPLDLTIKWRFRTEPGTVRSRDARAKMPTLSNTRSFVSGSAKNPSASMFGLRERKTPSSIFRPTLSSPASGQLGLGGAYFAGEWHRTNNANGFVRQAFVAFALPADAKLKLGRFTFSTAQNHPKNKSLATLVNTRLTQRLMATSVSPPVGRSYDGAQLTFNTHAGNFTLLGARPNTRRLSNRAMANSTLTSSMALHRPCESRQIFRRISALQSWLRGRAFLSSQNDNRGTRFASADHNHIRIGTYAPITFTSSARKITARSTFSFGELFKTAVGVSHTARRLRRCRSGWQPVIHTLNPWFRAGYSFGSGDKNPTDGLTATSFRFFPRRVPTHAFRSTI